MTDADAAAVNELLDRFGAALFGRDLEASMSLLADGADVVVIPSEGVDVHRGTEEVRAFLERIYGGPRRYGWHWRQRNVSVDGSTAWFVAEGDESVDESGARRIIPYCITGVAVRNDDGWRFRLLHASEDPTRTDS